MAQTISELTNFLFNFQFSFNLEIFKILFFCSIVGTYIRFILSLVNNQNWVRTYSQMIIFSILPTTGFLITNVIANSIALSLGMVGALSIVRFRTPVKNPTELVVYFLLISIGIVINVNPGLALNFIIFITFILVVLESYSKLIRKKNSAIFKEEELFVLNLVLNKNHNFENHKKLIKHQSSDGTNYLFRFVSYDLNELLEIKDSIAEDLVISYSIDN